LKESSLIYFQGKPHKEIYFQGKYHKAMYIGNQLVWGKLSTNDKDTTDEVYSISFSTNSIDGYSGDGDYIYMGQLWGLCLKWEGNIEIDWGDGYITKANSADYKYIFEQYDYANFSHSYYYPSSNVITDSISFIEDSEVMDYLGLESYYDEDLEKQITYKVDNSEEAYNEYLWDENHPIYLQKGYYDGSDEFAALDRFLVEKNCTEDSFPKTITIKGYITNILFPCATGSDTYGGVVEIFDKLPKSMKDTTSFGFGTCSDLYKIPDDFFDNLTNLQDLSYCFSDCPNLSYAPPLWEKYGDEVNHEYCFQNCYGASNYDDIPDDWK
jgi:hypothetical protein